VNEALAEDIRSWHGRDAFDKVLHSFNKTMVGWKEDVIRLRLLMKKLCRDRITITDRDLRQAYKASYGEKVEYRMILWPKEQKKQAEDLYETIRGNDAEFDRAARNQPTAALAASEGLVPPLGRHSGNEKLEQALFRLAPGQISPLIDLPEGTAVMKCIRRIPADTTKRFEDVRECLKQEVLHRLLQQEMARFFLELKERARPKVLWTPEAEKKSP
jgi:hypothetical protein